MHDVSQRINDAPSWDEGLRVVLGRICESEGWQIGFVYLPDREDPNVIVPVIGWVGAERVRAFHAASQEQRYARGQNLPGRVFAEGVPIWVNDPGDLLARLPLRVEAARHAGLRAAAALPILFGRDVIAVLELFSDEPHAPDELLENLMNDVSAQIGKVLERERATAQMADLVWREQQGLLHTLHDSLGQTLTGLGMLSAGLRHQLTEANPAAAGTARQVAEQAQLALEQVRQLSRGLFPVEIDPASLLSALRDLASTTETFHKIRVRIGGEVPGTIRDSRVATQLYRIAQEAVTNAVKHAHAHTVRIEISGASGLTRLRITDDGTGIEKGPLKGDGLGLRIMRYRATSIGGQLSIDRGSGGGTVVTCTLREPPLPPESESSQ
jgi:signal transduction histidine kinase